MKTTVLLSTPICKTFGVVPFCLICAQLGIVSIHLLTFLKDLVRNILHILVGLKSLCDVPAYSTFQILSHIDPNLPHLTKSTQNF